MFVQRQNVSGNFVTKLPFYLQGCSVQWTFGLVWSVLAFLAGIILSLIWSTLNFVSFAFKAYGGENSQQHTCCLYNVQMKLGHLDIFEIGRH